MNGRAREFIGERAAALGFTGVGFARAEPLGLEAERFETWLERGFAAGMRWLGARRAERCDPASSFGARSVVVLAMPYGSEQGEPRPGEGRIARYARGRDYHNLIGKRLRRLRRELLAAFPEAQARGYVDTGPVLEKAWAQRAGLGWLGKNTLIIREGSGSYHFLGVLFVSLALEPSLPVPDLCGSCRLCLESCPTGALVDDYVLDARRCLSYLTIEERGAVPEELRLLFGDHLFGCDVCQEVCPWNRAAAACVEPDFRRGPEHEELDLLLTGAGGSFSERYQGRALQRARREGMARSAAIVAGAGRDVARLPALAAALASEPSPLVRLHVAWALGRLGGEAARAALTEAGRCEREPEVRAAIAAAAEAAAATP